MWEMAGRVFGRLVEGDVVEFRMGDSGMEFKLRSGQDMVSIAVSRDVGHENSKPHSSHDSDFPLQGDPMDVDEQGAQEDTWQPDDLMELD